MAESTSLGPSSNSNDNLQKVLNQLMSTRGGEVCLLLEEEDVDLTTWLCVYRNPPNYPKFTVKKFTVPRYIDFGENDVSDAVMKNIEEIELTSIEDVKAMISERYGKDLASFESPWVTGCPF